MNKIEERSGYNWKSGIWMFIVGYVLFFWALKPEFLGIWIGICLLKVIYSPQRKRELRKEDYIAYLNNFTVKECKDNKTFFEVEERRTKALSDYFLKGDNAKENFKRFYIYDENDREGIERLRAGFIRNRFSESEKVKFLYKDQRENEFLPINTVFTDFPFTEFQPSYLDEQRQKYYETKGVKIPKFGGNDKHFNYWYFNGRELG